MATQDHAFRNNTYKQSLAPAARLTGGSPFNGTGVDTAGYESACALIDFGAWTDGTHTPKLQDSPDNSTFTDVAAGNLDGSFTAVSSGAGQNQTYKVGYKGAQRYLRVVMTVAGTTTGAVSAATIVLGDPIAIPAP